MFCSACKRREAGEYDNTSLVSNPLLDKPVDLSASVVQALERILHCRDCGAVWEDGMERYWLVQKRKNMLST